MTAAPQPLGALRDRILALHRAGNRDGARPLYARYLAQRPGDGMMWSNLGALLRADGRHDLSRAAQRRAAALIPDEPTVRNNLANILGDLGENDEALALRRGLAVTRPDDPQMRAMIGKSLRSLGRYDEAVAELSAAATDHPGHVEIRIQLAMAQLAARDYATGFRTYDARWETEELTPRAIDRPKWDGGPLAGLRILVLPEQGFGDGFAFARFLPALRALDPAEVILRAEGPVARLYDGVAGADRVVTDIPDVAEFDVWTNVMDLPPLHFDGSNVVPPPVALTVPRDATDRATDLLRPYAHAFRVGVVWTGSVTYRGNAFRSFPHRHLHRLLDLPDLAMLSLYKGPEAQAFRDDGTACLIPDIGSHDRDFADCAALMRGMDLIVTSDTATAHLAGSLGVPVWMLLHWDPFWLWGHEGNASPWYPSMRILRQSRPRDWDGVFDRLYDRLVAQIDRWRARAA